MRDPAALLCQQDRKTSAAGAAVKYSADSVQVFQQFPLDMILLDDIVDISRLPAAFQFSLFRKVAAPRFFGCNPWIVAPYFFVSVRMFTDSAGAS